MGKPCGHLTTAQRVQPEAGEDHSLMQAVFAAASLAAHWARDHAAQTSKAGRPMRLMDAMTPQELRALTHLAAAAGH